MEEKNIPCNSAVKPQGLGYKLSWTMTVSPNIF